MSLPSVKKGPSSTDVCVEDTISEILTEECHGIREGIAQCRDLLSDASLSLNATLLGRSEVLNGPKGLRQYVQNTSQVLSRCKTALETLSGRSYGSEDIPSPLQHQIGLLVTAIDDGAISAISEWASGGLESADRATEAANQDVAEAVRSLQFEDMVIQLTDYILKRLEHVEKLAEVISYFGGSECEHCSRQEFRTAIANYHEQMKEKLHKSVNQEDLSAGEIELF